MNDGRIEPRLFAIRSVAVALKRRCMNAVSAWKPVVYEYGSVTDVYMDDESRARFAAGLESLNAAGGALSEQLTSQHFSHVDYEVGAVSA